MFAIRLARSNVFHLACALLLLSSPAAAQPRLFRDFNPGGESAIPSPPLNVKVSGQRGFWREFFGDPGRLWMSDGSPEGTRLLKSSPILRAGSETEVAGPVGGRWLLAIEARGLGRELWTTDGTTEGTFLLKDFDPGERWGMGSFLKPIGDKLLFFAWDPAERLYLWATDGTLNGTAPVKALFSERTGVRFGSWAPLEEEILLTLGLPQEDETIRYQLWRSDGTGPGTFAVADLGLERPTFLPKSDGLPGPLALFVLSTALWSTDGTAAGTRQIGTFDEGDGSARSLEEARLVNGRILAFVEKKLAGPLSLPVDCELWSTDGTAAGTSKVASLKEHVGNPPGDDFFDCSDELALLGDRLFFKVRRPGFGPTPLWETDGTLEGTVLAIDDVSGERFFPRNLLSFRDELWFTSRGPSGFGQVYRSDGTAQGTALVEAFGAASEIYSLGDRLLIAGGPDFEDQTLWGTDGTEEGTQRLLQPELRAERSFPGNFLRLGERLLFSALAPGFGEELWVSDGSPEGTSVLDARPSGSTRPVGLHREGQQSYFLEGNVGIFSPGGVWRSDGTLEGTRKLTDGVHTTDAVPLGQHVYISRSVAEETELWRTDGTPQGTTLVKDIFPGLNPFDQCDDGPCPNSSSPGDLLRLGDRILFTAEDEAHGRELWITNGTEAGTRLVSDLTPGPESSSPTGWTVHGDRVFFIEAANLWVTDGTNAGTLRLTAAADPLVRGHSNPVLFRGRVFFVETLNGGTFAPRLRLWTSDGTPAGTRPSFELPSVTALYSTSFSFFGARENPFVVAGSRLFFSAASAETGDELWVTDGTLQGTRQVRDIAPGPPSSFPRNLRAIDGVVLFAATDGASGHELWRSDGTEEGTWAVGEINPGLASSTPGGFTPIGDQVLFAASSTETGGEVWAVGREEIRAPCSPGPGRLCLAEGRYEAVVDWHNPRTGARGTGASSELSDDTGAFSFFNEENIELLVKMLDGRQRNGHHWFFFGALSDVEYWITMTDFETGRVETFHNPAFNLCGLGDTGTFDDLDATLSDPPIFYASWTEPAPDLRGLTGSGTSCAPGPEALMLGGGRFTVEVAWHNQRTGASGEGTAVPGTDESGYFWFFRPGNLELAVKLLDGTANNGHFWFFYGALSDLEYELRVKDLTTCQERIYRNPPGEICGQADLFAFDG